MERVQTINYPIRLASRGTKEPFHVLRMEPFENEMAAQDFMDYTFEDEWNYRQGTCIAIPFKGKVLVPRSRDIDNLDKVWATIKDNVYEKAISKSIGCKKCESKFLRDTLKGLGSPSQCPICSNPFGGTTMENRVKKNQDALLSRAEVSMGICHLIVRT